MNLGFRILNNPRRGSTDEPLSPLSRANSAPRRRTDSAASSDNTSGRLSGRKGEAAASASGGAARLSGLSSEQPKLNGQAADAGAGVPPNPSDALLAEEAESGDDDGDPEEEETRHLRRGAGKPRRGPSEVLWRRLCESSNAELAAAKAIGELVAIERVGSVGVEAASVYGSAIAIPQIARSCNWPGTFIGLVVRSYIFLLVNYFLQFFLISMIGEEMFVLSPFSGRMHLCDFGRDIARCPDAADCQGPGGTPFSYARLYSFEDWTTRKYVRDALLQLFPDRREAVMSAADPGEFGLENYMCRMVCVFIFLMAVQEELQAVHGMFRLLYYVPTMAEPWIRYTGSDFDDKDVIKVNEHLRELDLVKFQVAGIPWYWKTFYVMFVATPKLVLWFSLSVAGIRFLMETAGILDTIINAMAITFILDVDELVFSRLSTHMTKHIMAACEDYQLYDISEEEGIQDIDVLKRYRAEELGRGRWRKLQLIVPRRLLLVLILQVLFVSKYYYLNCDLQEDGSWVSKDVFLPESLTYRPLAFLLGIKPDGVAEPYWTMPEE